MAGRTSAIRNIAARICVCVFVLTHGGVRADPAGEALLQKCLDAEGKIQSLQANFTLKQQTGEEMHALQGTLKLQKPNLALISISGAEASDARTLASDGKQFTTYFKSDNEYRREPADPSGGNIGRAVSTEVTAFFNPDALNQLRSMGTGIKITGKLSMGGAVCKTLQVTGAQANSIYKIYVGTDFLVHGLTLAYDGPTGRSAVESRLTDLKTGPARPPATFAFTLPRGVKPWRDHLANTSASSGTEPADAKMLPAGATAPDFQLFQPDGSKLTFSSVYKSHRTTLLSFWNYKFAPCRDALPDLNKMLFDLKDKSFDIVTVNSEDDAKTLQKFWKENNLALRAVIHGKGVAEKYHVSAVPTNYLVGKNGKIIGAFEGFDETAIRAAIPGGGKNSR